MKTHVYRPLDPLGTAGLTFLTAGRYTPQLVRMLFGRVDVPFEGARGRWIGTDTENEQWQPGDAAVQTSMT